MDIQVADKKHRNKWLVIIGLIALVFIVLIYLMLFPGLDYVIVRLNDSLVHEREELAFQVRLIIYPIGLLLLCFFVFIGLYLQQQAKKVRLNERFPIPGQKVMRDTEILSGKPALEKARVLHTQGFYMMIYGIIFFIAFVFIAEFIAGVM